MFDLASTPFAPSSNWNTPIGTDATYSKLNWPASDGYNYAVNWDTYSPAVYVASPTDPLVQVSVPASWGYPGGTVGVHMPAEANGAVGTDKELVVVDGDTAFNFWEFNRTSTTTASADAYGLSSVTTGSGWGSSSPFLSAGITAAGSSELGGLLVQAETDTGRINHALQLVVDSGLVKSGFTGAAIAGDGGSASGIVQEGDHLAISPDTPMPSGLSALGQEVFHALQQYGAYVVDVAGGATLLRAQANAYDETTMTALWHDLGSITPLLGEVTGGTPASSPAPTSTSTSASGSGMTDPAGAPTDPPGTPAIDPLGMPATDPAETPAPNDGASGTVVVSGSPTGSGSSGTSPAVGSHAHHHSGSSAGSATGATDTCSTSHHHDHQAQTDFWSALIDAVHNIKSAPTEANGAVQLGTAGFGTADTGAALHALHDLIAAAHGQVGHAIDVSGSVEEAATTQVADAQTPNGVAVTDPAVSSGHGNCHNSGQHVDQFASNHMDFGHDHGQHPGQHQHFEQMWHHA